MMSRCWARPVRGGLRFGEKAAVASYYSMNFQHGFRFDMSVGRR